jgi:hypothetical protein
MSEGGVFPWKRQSTRKAAPTADYARLLQPLPEPPAGLQWIKVPLAESDGNSHNPNAPRAPRTEWRLIATSADAVAVEEPDYGDSSAAATCVVLVEEDALLATPPVTATATLATDGDPLLWRNVSTVAEATFCSSLAAAAAADALPQATLVTGVAARSNNNSNNTNTTAMKGANNGKGEEHILDNDDPLGRLDTYYTRHVVLPTDTLAGLCLTYRISKRELLRANGMYSAGCGSGDSLRLAPETLIVPITEKARRLGWKIQDTNSREFQMAAVLARCPSLSPMEVQWYVARLLLLTSTHLRDTRVR